MRGISLKVILVCLYAILCKCMVFADTLISRDIEQNGVLFASDQITTSSEPLTIYLIDDQISGDWTLEVLKNNKEYETISLFSVYPDHCTFDPKTISWWKAHKTYSKEHNQHFFTLKASFKANCEENDFIIIKLGLVPSKPIISNINFTYKYDWEFDDIYPNGVFAFDITSERAVTYMLNLSDSFRFEPPESYFVCWPYDAHATNHIEYDADWGEYLIIEATNEFGTIYSDEICTTDYIYDEKVLNRINELKKMADENSIDIDHQEPSFILDNNSIIFNALPPDKIHIFDLTGRIHYSGGVSPQIDISGLHKGIYILDYNVGSKSYKSKIIIK